MDANTRLELLFQMSGYFRKKEQTSEQGIGESMEKMLMIGICFGAGGEMAARNAMTLWGFPSHWQKTVVDILKAV